MNPQAKAFAPFGIALAVGGLAYWYFTKPKAQYVAPVTDKPKTPVAAPPVYSPPAPNPNPYPVNIPGPTWQQTQAPSGGGMDANGSQIGTTGQADTGWQDPALIPDWGP